MKLYSTFNKLSLITLLCLGLACRRWLQALMTVMSGMAFINRIMASSTTGLITAGITGTIKTTAAMRSGAAIASIKSHTL